MTYRYRLGEHMTEYRFELRKQYPLDGIGTRWDHYAELREVFALGISVIESEMKYHRSEFNELKLAKLKHAVEMIDYRLNLLSGYDEANESFGSFDNMLRRHEQEKRQKNAEWTAELKSMTEGTNEPQKPKDSDISSTSQDSDTPPDEPIGV